MFACNDDNADTPKSVEAELLDFQVGATSDITPVKTYIDHDKNEIHVFNNEDFKSSDFPISLAPELEISSGATVVPASGTSVSFADPEDFIKYVITSENGAITSEYIFTVRDNQMPNSEFENWFQEIGMNGKPFQQPGKYAESTVWATPNMGTSIYSIYGTSPIIDGNNTLMKIETVETVALPLVAGTLYVGEFDLDGAIEDPTNPVAAAKLGVPFFSKPSAVQFKYSYTAGGQMIQAVLKDPGNLFGGFDIYNLEGKDKFGIEVKLEKRVGDAVTVIAQENFESDVIVENLIDLKLDLEYFSTEEPTHFYISFSPSLEGGAFKGAIGSTLIIDDLELIYD